MGAQRIYIWSDRKKHEFSHRHEDEIPEIAVNTTDLQRGRGA